MGKYPQGYAASVSPIAVWGLIRVLLREVEELVWGSGAREAEAKDRVKAE